MADSHPAKRTLRMAVDPKKERAGVNRQFLKPLLYNHAHCFNHRSSTRKERAQTGFNSRSLAGLHTSQECFRKWALDTTSPFFKFERTVGHLEVVVLGLVKQCKTLFDMAGFDLLSFMLALL